MNEHKPLQNNFRNKQRKAVLKLVALLLVVVTLISTAAWSWFGGDDSDKVTADGVNISMLTVNNNLELSIKVGDQFTEYTPAIDLLNDTELLKDLDMVPVTGLGSRLTSNNQVHLYIPQLTYGNDGEVTPNRDKDWTEAVANEDYISLEVKFKSKNGPANIYIGKGTEVIMKAEDMKQPLTGSNASNISRYGNFTRDAIVGALRMSVAAPEETLKFIWNPRPDLSLKKQANGALDLEISSVTQSLWSYKHPYYKTDAAKTPDEYPGCPQTANAFTATSDGGNTLTDSSKIGTTVVDENGDYVCTAFIKIWVDGCDSEAVRALSRGRFLINLNFVAIDIPI